MANSCIVTKLNAAVDNDALRFYNRITVTLAYPGNSFTYVYYKGSSEGGKAGEFISGKLYANSARTQLITDKLPIGSGNYSVNIVFNGEHVDNPELTRTKINLVKNNIWCIGNVVERAFVNNGSVYSQMVWFRIDWDAVLHSRLSIFDISTLAVEQGQKVRIEDFFVAVYNRLKRDNSRNFEDASLVRFYPAILHCIDMELPAQNGMTFNNQRFYNKRLFISTDIDNNQFTLYDTATNFNSVNGYNISNAVASYNATTKEWTYNL